MGEAGDSEADVDDLLEAGEGGEEAPHYPHRDDLPQHDPLPPGDAPE